ncbi:MAG: biotin transporter BioY [Gemmatimonadales bacterium]
MTDRHIDSTLPALEVSTTSRTGRRAVAIVLGAVLVAAGAQVAVPVPGSAVPATLQPLAVLIVGGLLGPAAGVMALVAYLSAGALGLPVFAPGGAPGIARLIGPTGGYLLAFPVAAAVVGMLARRRPGAPAPGLLRVLAGAILGVVVIHIGGVAQLTLLTGSPAVAFQAGVVPFLVPDAVKVLLAAFIIAPLRAPLGKLL